MRTRWAVEWRFWNSCTGELPFAFPNSAGGEGRANKTPLPLWGSEAGYTPLLKVPRANATRKDDIYNCPPPLGSPRFARGTALCARSVPSACREHREACHSVPTASRGNLKEGVIKTTQIMLATVIAMALSACQPNNATPPTAATNPTPPPADQPPPQPDIPTFGYKIVNTFPHDPQAFTQGLEFHDGYLYEGTGLKGKSSLRRVELRTGRILQIHRLPSEYFGEGITILGDKLYQLTWQNGVCFVYDRRAFRQITQFRYDGEGWGLTNDGKHLIMSDGSEVITFRAPDTFAEVRRITVRAQGKPVKNLNELEYIEGEIWANIWYSDIIARIDPSTGIVKAWVDLEGLPVPNRDIEAVLNGIAYDRQNKRIFVTGKNWSKLFEIELVPPRNASPTQDDATR
jgi:glutamine cyclotransferase